MVIGIDAHSLGSRQCGNEVYTYNLLKGLSEIDRLNQYYLFVLDKNTAYRNGLLEHNNFNFILLPAKNRWFRVPFALGTVSFLKKLDILHTQYFAPPISHGKLVVTIHDICFKSFPQFFSKKELFIFRFVRFAIRKANRIIAVSDFTKKELISRMDVDPEKIDVVYNGVNEVFKPIKDWGTIAKVKAKYGIEGEFILYVGRINVRKNIINLIKAYALLKQEMHTPQLVIIGELPSSDSDILVEMEQNLRLTAGILIPGYVPTEDLPFLYNGAKLFVYPSFYEGFGLPVIEAMACGIPVITSNTSVFPELTEMAALLIDPNSIEELKKAMKNVLVDSDLRNRLICTGLERAKKFSWKQTAILTLQSYAKAS